MVAGYVERREESALRRSAPGFSSVFPCLVGVSCHHAAKAQACTKARLREKSETCITYWFNTEWPGDGKAVEDYVGWIDFPNNRCRFAFKNTNDAEVDASLRSAIDKYFLERTNTAK